MTENEYNYWDNIVVKAISITAMVLALTAGCMNVSSKPDDYHAEDRRNIFQHAKDYWAQDKEVVEPDPLIEQGQIEAYNQGFKEAIRQVVGYCQSRQWFYVDNQRYGCLPTRTSNAADGQEGWWIND